jgi:hypothetical protein
MTADDAKAALMPVGMVGALGMFLPGFDGAWKADPGDRDARNRLYVGECAYMTLALGIGLLASKATGNGWALVLTVGWAGSVILMEELALKHRPK